MSKKLVVDTSTGEVEREILPGDRIVRKKSTDYLKAKKKLIRSSDESFFKWFISSIDGLLECDLAPADFRVMLKCFGHLMYTTGAVKFSKNGDFLSIDDLANSLKFSRMTVSRSLNVLTENEILYKERVGRNIRLYVNPFICIRGSEITRDLYNKAKDSKWAKLFYTYEKKY